MTEQTSTFHNLETREYRNGEWLIWHSAQADIHTEYREAFTLAYQGRLIEALESAERSRIQNHGNMNNCEFRIVTKSTTITRLGGHIE